MIIKLQLDHCNVFFDILANLFTDFPIFYIAICSKLVFFGRVCVCEYLTMHPKWKKDMIFKIFVLVNYRTSY
jgi:hypothetical protein